MKSLFKRTLAAATGSILALSQFAAVTANVNVTAADETPAASSSAVTIDKDFVLFVPIDEKEPMNGLHSDWNDKLETALMGTTDKTFTFGLERGKTEAKKIMLWSDRIDSATADEILAAVSAATVKTTSDGKGTAEIEIADLGQIAGRLIEQEMRIQNDGKEGTVGGKPVKADWSKLNLSGKVKVEAETDFAKKTVSYQVTFIDEKGTEYKDYKGIEQYVLAKVDEAAALLKDAAAKNGGNTAKFNDKLDKYVAKAKKGEGYIAKMVEAVQAITATNSTPDGLYTDYTGKLVDAAKSVGAPDYYTNKSVNKFNEEKPATVSQFWTDERVQKEYDKAVDLVKENFGEYVDVTLKLSDIQSIVEGANSAEYTVPNGYSVEAILNIDDDKADEVEKAIRDKHEAEWLANGYKIVSIDSSKKITAKADTEYAMKGELFYDVERIINVVTEPITTTTTTTSVVSSETTTTTTVTDSNTTPSETTSTDTDTNTTPTQTETTSTDTDTNTTPTETTPTDTDTNTTPTQTETTPATYASFEFEGIEDEGLVYWSEEDSKFDLSKLSVSLHFYEGGVEQVRKTVDVTGAFAAEYDNPSQLTMPERTGLTVASVYFKLTDEAAVQKAITDAGYSDLIEEQGIKNGLEAGKFSVYLVLRGDTNLDGKVGVQDSQLALVYYTETKVAQKDASELLNDPDCIYLEDKGADQVAFFPYSHYAMDVDGNGEITVEDSQNILKYYTEINVSGNDDVTWDHAKIFGEKKIPREDLHAEPLGRDTYAAEYVGLRKKLAEQGN
ncbi:MAG: hypothetical protein IKI77_05065 [Oscillospiraceae bacterium]|nr:hypothetical protein [Oscillospiraceae bacterium]